jgi:hypothetical protein
MAQNGKLKLEMVDVYGKRLKEKVDISLNNQKVPHNLFFKGHDATKPIQISGLHTTAERPYKLTIDPPSYHVVTMFVNVKTSGTTELQIPFPIDAAKVTGVNFPTFASLSKEARGVLTNSPAVSGFEHKTGADLFEALDPIRCAGFLNIACKTLATIFHDGANVLSLIKELRIVRGDRFFAFVDPALRDDTINSISTGLFHKADSSLHTLPPEFVSFEGADSFKTDDLFGNLQLTFFRRGEEMVADIDLDDAAGIRHIFQVLKNHFTGSPTHPYNIHEILVKHQKLDPKYTFNI